MWPYPKIIAHRGGGSLSPENTLAAFECGFKHGFRAVEFDVMLSGDQIPLVVHDEQLGRTVPGQGLVSALPASELLLLDAGSWYGPEFAHARIPTYEQVLEFCQCHAIWMNVEIKPAAGVEALTGEIVARTTRQFYQSTPAQIAPLFSSFSMTALAAAKIAAPEIARGLLFDQIPANWQQHVTELEAVAIHTNHRYLTPELAQQIRQAGLGLSCYTVNNPARAREILAWGVEAIFTDALNLITADFV